MFRSQVEPHVVVYAKSDERRPSIIVLVIENIGKGLAKDVEFELPKAFPGRAFGIGPDDAKTAKPMQDTPLIGGIPSLGPGAKRVITWGQWGGLYKALGDSVANIKVRFKSDPIQPLNRPGISGDSIS